MENVGGSWKEAWPYGEVILKACEEELSCGTWETQMGHGVHL